MEVEFLPGMVVVRDRDGHRHAAPINAVRGVHEHEDGVSISFAGGQVAFVSSDFDSLIREIGWARRR